MESVNGTEIHSNDAESSEGKYCSSVFLTKALLLIFSSLDLNIYMFIYMLSYMFMYLHAHLSIILGFEGSLASTNI